MRASPFVTVDERKTSGFVSWLFLSDQPLVAPAAYENYGGSSTLVRIHNVLTHIAPAGSPIERNLEKLMMGAYFD